MEKIRLPEDFTDRVMQKIEQRERAAARRQEPYTDSHGQYPGSSIYHSGSCRRPRILQYQSETHSYRHSTA